MSNFMKIEILIKQRMKIIDVRVQICYQYNNNTMDFINSRYLRIGIQLEILHNVLRTNILSGNYKDNYFFRTIRIQNFEHDLIYIS